MKILWSALLHRATITISVNLSTKTKKHYLTNAVGWTASSNCWPLNFNSSSAADGLTQYFFSSVTNSELSLLSTAASWSSAEVAEFSPRQVDGSDLANFLFFNTEPCLELSPFRICRRRLLRTRGLVALNEAFFPSTPTNLSNGSRNLYRNNRYISNRSDNTIYCWRRLAQLFKFNSCATVALHTRNTEAPFTRYNLLSNQLDNRLYRVYKHSTGWQMAVSRIQPVVKPVVQPSLTTGWTNSGCSFNAVVKPVVKPGLTTGLTCWTNSCSFNALSNRVVQPVWEPAVSRKRGMMIIHHQTTCTRRVYGPRKPVSFIPKGSLW